MSLVNVKAAVEMWFDPICPWAWLTARWLMEVEQVRDVEGPWLVMQSVDPQPTTVELSPEYRSTMDSAWGPVRVIIAAARDHGLEVVKPLYDAMGSRIHVGGEKEYLKVIAPALEECGLPADLAGSPTRPRSTTRCAPATSAPWTWWVTTSARR